MTAVVLQPNNDNIAAEVLEGDAVIMNIATSVYYSTEGLGGWIWEQCAAGTSLEDIARDIVARNDIGIEQVRADLGRFTDMLVKEGLVRITTVETDTVKVASASNGHAAGPYSAPILNCYRDMKDLLALDPPMPRFTLDK